MKNDRNDATQKAANALLDLRVHLHAERSSPTSPVRLRGIVPAETWDEWREIILEYERSLHPIK